MHYAATGDMHDQVSLICSLNFICLATVTKDCYNSTMNPFTEEASGTRLRSTSSGSSAKKVERIGFYSEYKPVSTENSLVMVRLNFKLSYCKIFWMTIFCVEERPRTTSTFMHAHNLDLKYIFNQTTENPRYSVGSDTQVCCLLAAAQGRS
jgi:hypothetical protein